MRLRDVGERGLIERIERLVRRAPRSAHVALGIGDDAALLRTRAGEELVVTTDALVEGVHFRFDQETPRIAGRRALAANLSDLAAMGARPLGCVLALAAPASAPLAAVLDLVRGMLDVARRHALPARGRERRARARALALDLRARRRSPRARPAALGARAPATASS